MSAKAEVRYTINLDGTVEKWYLEKQMLNIVFLRKTKTPKWNCCMHEFPPEAVYPSYAAARKAINHLNRRND